jgi:hypothetical protein
VIGRPKRREERHTVARVTDVKVKPEDVGEAVRLFDDSVIPAAEQEEGFMGALLLTREDGRALVVDLSDRVEHKRANERGASVVRGAPQKERERARFAVPSRGGSQTPHHRER